MRKYNLDGSSLDILEENIRKMKELFPEVFTEEKIDFEKLQQVLGEYIEDEAERYDFTWNGKKDALRISQTPTTGTLRPDKENSKNWEETENIYIEGDNLEVLKLLQKSYHSKIKMIYIDPPYNTGNDFVYKDNYRDNMKNYLKFTGQVDNEGKKMSTNSELGGRYHTDWLNMMYPRLRLARNLLRDDGVIFISIDDNEVHNLRKICDEIFGEDNFIGNITWEKRTKAQNTIDARNMLQSKTEYIQMYKKRNKKARFNLKISGEIKYEKKDDFGRYRLHKIEEMSALGMRGRKTMVYPIYGVYPGKDKQWKLGENTINQYKQRGDLLIIDNQPYLKIRETDEDSKIYNPFWSHFFEKEVSGTAEQGKKELDNILNTKNHGFETVKPLRLIKKLIFHNSYNTSKSKRIDDFIILDFFAGSSTTAHAVMDLNAEDNGNRKFIMVQLPEETDKKSEAFKAGYKTISDIGRERIRRAGEKIKEKNKNKEEIEDLDIGFKAFKLDSSNIKEWNPKYKEKDFDFESLVNNFVEGRNKEDILYEIILKYGINLTTPMKEHFIDEKTIYDIGFGSLYICLENDIDEKTIEKIVSLNKDSGMGRARVVFKDTGFKNDEIKLNAKLTLENNGIEEVLSI